MSSRCRPMLAVVALLLVSATTSACAAQDGQAEELQRLRSELADAAAAETEREERIAALEEAVTDLEGLETSVSVLRDTTRDLAEADPTERLDTTDEELAGMAATLRSLEEDLTAAAAAGEAVGDDLVTTASELRTAITSVRGSVDELGGEVEELRTLYGTLRDRLDRLQRDD